MRTPTDPTVRHVGAAAALALGLAALFQGGLLFGGHLGSLDWDVHYHYYDWIRTALVEHGTLPLYMVDAWHTPNFVANAQSPVLGPLVWLLTFLETDHYIKLLIWLYTAAGMLGAYWLARDLGAGTAVAAVATVVWSMSGFFAAHVSVGHHWSLGAYLAPLLLFFVRRAIAGSVGALLAAAGVNALAALEGQHHPFLWQNGLLVAWAALEAVRRRDLRPLRCTAIVLALTFGLAAVRLVPVLAEFADYMPGWRIGGIPPAALPFSLLSPDQDRATAGHGVVFQYGSGWWEYTFYLGAAGLVFVAVGAAAAARRTWPLLAVGAVLFLASLDTRSLGFDAWSWLAHWPVVSSQRGPSRLLGVALLPLAMAAAPGWQRILDAAERQWPGRGARVGAVAVLAVGLFVTVDLLDAARGWQAGSVGAAQTSRPHRIGAARLLRTPGTVTPVSIGPNHLRYAVEAERAGLLVLPLDAARQRGQWRAGNLPLVTGPGGTLAVGVPAGSREVALRFRPRGLVPGAVLSGVTLAGIVGFLVWKRRGGGARRRRTDGADD